VANVFAHEAPTTPGPFLIGFFVANLSKDNATWANVGNPWPSQGDSSPFSPAHPCSGPKPNKIHQPVAARAYVNLEW
jgi:hypothetical protein